MDDGIEGSSSSLLKKLIASRPSARSSQNSSIFFAPGKRPAIPMIAMSRFPELFSVLLICATAVFLDVPPSHEAIPLIVGYWYNLVMGTS